MPSVTIVHSFHYREIETLLHNPKEGLGRDMMRRGQTISTIARILCPARTGKLRASINVSLEETGQGISVCIGTVLPYADMVHTGTGIHGPHRTYIRPHGRCLVWKNAGTGSIVFSTRSSGQYPRPFLIEALRIGANL